MIHYWQSMKAAHAVVLTKGFGAIDLIMIMFLKQESIETNTSYNEL